MATNQEEKGLTKNQLISLLTRSSHGELDQYLPDGKYAAKHEPDFMAHLIAWNHIKGQIRDSKVALPIIQLTETTLDFDYKQNALAHLASLDPRNLVKAVRFAKKIKTVGNTNQLEKMIKNYLKEREDKRNWFDRTVLQHRVSMKELYALFHIKPSTHANDILFKKKKIGIFKTLSELKLMSNKETASVLIVNKIPLLTAQGYLGSRLKEPELLMALIENMSANELINNTKMLQKYGLSDNPALRAAYENGLKKVVSGNKATFKTTRAVSALMESGSTGDIKLAEKLKGIQEKQIDNMANVEGNWLVAVDASSSQTHSIELGKQVAAVLARSVKGNVYFVSFDTTPRFIDVTRKTLDEIIVLTKGIQAQGCTSIGCSLDYILQRKLEVDGICLISDGSENTSPNWCDTYNKYISFVGKDIPIYWYHTKGDTPNIGDSMNKKGIQFTTFDLTHGNVDYYSLPNIISTMRTNQYSLVDEIFATPLLRLDDIFCKISKDVDEGIQLAI